MTGSEAGRQSCARGARTRRALLVGLSLALLAGCGGQAESPAGVAALQAVADTVYGIPRSTWPETPFPELGWHFDTLFVVGGYDADGSAYQFDQVEPGGIAGDSSDRLFVLDAAGKRLLGFGPEGRPIGTWGREGGGPGELNSPSGLGVGPADSLWVVDRGNRRVTVFPPDPEGVPSDLALDDESAGLAGAVAVDPAGVVGMALTFSFRPGEEVEYPPRRLIRLARDGAILDTVWTSPPPMFDRIELTTGNQIAIMLSQRSFSPGLFWQRFGDGGFAVAEKADYEISLLRPDGSERLRIRREPEARLTTEADRQRAREAAREQAEESGSTFVRQSVEERIDKMTFADRVPRITGLAVDGADRLWVGVATERPGETGRIDVYDRDGAPIGEVRTGPILPTSFFGDSRAALLDRDELDVQRVVVLQLIEPEST